MSKHFTNLHVHTDFSLLDGAIKLDKLIEFGKKNNFKALSISDHGNIFGAVKFFQKCKKNGIKPILGIEIYFAEDATVKNIDNKYYHLLLLVQNKAGYKNLCKLLSYAFKEGFYFKPRIDYKMLEKHSEGLIACTACLGGHIPSLLLADRDEEAEKWIDWFIRVFTKERFYLEVQPHNNKETIYVNEKLFKLAEKKGLKCVATSDSHYVNHEDKDAHEIMLAIQTHSKITDENRMSLAEYDLHLRTEQESLDFFKEHPEAIWTTGEIADKCNFDFETGKLFLPEFPIPENHTKDSFFKHLCQTGFDKLLENQRIPIDKKEIYQKRLELEMDLIIKMGFVGYFLIVSDFIQWAHRNGIPVGPGRGSAAGSIVAWCLEITNVDPIKYNLLFERFLNPERISMPDIDIDFCIEGREKVINYVKEKYGYDKVCQIITFGSMLAKGVIKDVARVLGFPFEDSNTITGLIPDQLKITLHEAIEQEPKLKELIESNPKIKELFDIAFKLEGLTRHASKHAAGIVISPDPIDEVLPLYIPAKSNELVTQYAMTELEQLGFLKMDFLGLKNLTLIDRVIKYIQKNHNIKININQIPLDDPKAFELVCEGKTSGVFQLESDGLKDVLRKLQPQKFEDIIAVNALYRPGPLGSGMVDDFIKRRHGRQKITYLLPELENILEETYGVILYQEQVMKIASAVAGYSLGEADILRKAMGKKKVEVMAEQRQKFLKGAKTNNTNEKKAEDLFDLMAYFAGYGFNKSHSTAYALIAYQTAYLKANYPAEFMACLISLEVDNPDKMSFYLDEAKDMGLEILMPDINKSGIYFTVVNNKILFGLNGIKSVGLAALENILKEKEKGPFKDVLNFCKRIDLRTANKRVIENLIYAGALDLLPGNRAQKINELERIMDLAVEQKIAEATGQMSLFGGPKPNKGESANLYEFQPLSPWNNKEKLEKEKEVAGFYLSAHPLDTYKKQIKKLNISTFDQALQKSKNAKQEPLVCCYGLLQNFKKINTKRGDKMAFASFEDKNSKAEVILFPKIFKKIEEWLDKYNVFIIKGALDLTSTNKCKIKANEFVPVELFFQEWQKIEKIILELPVSISENDITNMKQKLPKGNIPVELVFYENGKKFRLKSREKISLNQNVIDEIEDLGLKINLQI